MLKVAWLVRLVRDGDRAAIRRAWREEHAALLRAVPGLERCADNRTVAIAEGPGAGREEPAIDSVLCAWWADERALHAGLRSEAFSRVREHARAIITPGSGYDAPAVEVEERIMRAGPATPWRGAGQPAGLCKHIGVLAFRPDLTRAQASRYWTEVHGAIALEVGDIRNYVQNHAVRPVGPDGGRDAETLPFDGFSEAWFTDRATFERAHASPAWQRLQADAPNLFDVAALESGVNCVIDERVVKG